MSSSQASIDALVADAPAAEAPPPADGEIAVQTCSSAAAGPGTVECGRRREPDIEHILGLPVPLRVILAERLMSVESLLEITVGTIIEFDVPFDSDLTLQIGDRTIGHGEAVKVGESFGLRLSRIGGVQECVGALGSA